MSSGTYVPVYNNSIWFIRLKPTPSTQLSNPDAPDIEVWPQMINAVPLDVWLAAQNLSVVQSGVLSVSAFSWY
jgi:hypothetical protein